jgi:rhodanese-related sulfurtransferase
MAARANMNRQQHKEFAMPTKDEREPFHRITVTEARDMMDDGAVVIDVRNPDEYQAGHLPGATLIPVNSVFARREELPEDKKIIFVCAIGQRSALAAEMAAAGGLPADRIFSLDGGTDAWRKEGQAVE